MPNLINRQSFDRCHFPPILRDRDHHHLADWACIPQAKRHRHRSGSRSQGSASATPGTARWRRRMRHSRAGTVKNNGVITDQILGKSEK